jgi:hypothetical protein
MNIESVTYVTTNKFAITFVEPIYSSESWDTRASDKRSYYTVGLVSHNSGLSLVKITNQTYNGFTMELSGEKSAGELVGIVVYK